MCNPIPELLPKPKENPKTRIVLDFSTPRDEEKLNDPETTLSWPTPNVEELMKEAMSLFHLAFPILLTNLVLYLRALLSMLFLGQLGDSALAGGALAIAFANITGYSVLSGLSLGMEPICSQAFGAGRLNLLSLTLHRAVLFLLTASFPIALMWLQVPTMLSYLHQEASVSATAYTYILYSLPDLLTNSFLHPIKIYLRAQGITRPLTLAAFTGTVLHVPANVVMARYGVAGVASAAAASNLFSLLVLLALTPNIDARPTRACFSGWGALVRLAGPSCVSVCLEWWWYEIMIVLCGLLVDPTATVASMGILIQTTGLIYNFPSALGFAVSTRVGNELGAERPRRAWTAALVGIGAAVGMGVVAAGFAAGMRDRWGRMYTADGTILGLTAAALPVLGLCELGNCPQTVACGVVRGSARPSTAANVNLGAFYLVGTPVAVWLAFYAGVGFVGLWVGLLAAQICCAGLMFYVVGTTDWAHQSERAQKLTCTGGGSGLEEAEAEEEADLKEPLICVVVVPTPP